MNASRLLRVKHLDFIVVNTSESRTRVSLPVYVTRTNVESLPQINLIKQETCQKYISAHSGQDVSTYPEAGYQTSYQTNLQ